MPDKKHILILSSWYPSEKNPFLGNFVQRQAVLLSGSYKVTVLITESCSENLISSETKETLGITEVRVRYPKKDKLLEKRKVLEQAMTIGVETINDVDLIIGHVILPKGLQFVMAKKHFGCPLILVEHGSYFRPEQREKRSWVDKLIIRKVRKHLDEVVAVSEFLKKDMQTDFPKHTIHVIGNHVDAKLFHFEAKKAHGKTEFLHVSTMDERTKNPEGIICAFKTLKEEYTNFRLTIICDEDTSHWKELVKNFDMEENVDFVGPLQWDEVSPYYYNADAFVLFSDYESFSIVLAEAWATGTPVLTTDVGIAWKMDSSLGISVEKGDRKSLVSALKQFIMDSKEQFNNQKIASHGEQYSDEKILERWEALINKHIG